MNPPLTGAEVYEYKDWIYVVGGLGADNKPSDTIYRLSRDNPVRMDKFKTMKVPRVNCKAFKVGKKLVIMGGSAVPLIEAYDEDTLNEDASVKPKSESFFHQLACYTSDLKLENSTVC